jgi:hypothetical protein
MANAAVAIHRSGERCKQVPGNIPAWSRGSDTTADKPADRFDFRNDHRGPDTAHLRAWCDDPGDPQMAGISTDPV